MILIYVNLLVQLINNVCYKKSIRIINKNTFYEKNNDLLLKKNDDYKLIYLKNISNRLLYYLFIFLYYIIF